MGLADDVRNELKKLKEHKAFYAAAGAGDLAVEALRALPDRLARLQDKADLTALSGLAFEYVMLAGARAVQTYDELAERGIVAVNKVGQVDTQQAAAQLEQAARSTAKVTVRTANRTADAARKTATTTVRAASQAAAQAAIQASQAASQASQAAAQAAIQASQVAGRATQAAGGADSVSKAMAPPQARPRALRAMDPPATRAAPRARPARTPRRTAPDGAGRNRGCGRARPAVSWRLIAPDRGRHSVPRRLRFPPCAPTG